jgi:hypothetical protein
LLNDAGDVPAGARAGLRGLGAADLAAVKRDRADADQSLVATRLGVIDAADSEVRRGVWVYDDGSDRHRKLLRLRGNLAVR